jgi:phage-related protein
VDNADITRCNKEIASVKLSIAALDSKISSFMSNMSSTMSSASPDTQPSHVDVVSKRLSESVKQVVTETIDDRDKRNRDRTAATFYGLPEKRQDSDDVTYVLKAISIKCVPAYGVRLGHGAQPRPLKVIFNTVGDRDSVLRAAHLLKGNKVYERLSIRRFLNAEEMAKDKETRAECKLLNEKTSATGTNKKAYVVINGKIMSTRPDAKGKLQPYKPGEGHSSQPVASQSKNG